MKLIARSTEFLCCFHFSWHNCVHMALWPWTMKLCKHTTPLPPHSARVWAAEMGLSDWCCSVIGGSGSISPNRAHMKGINGVVSHSLKRWNKDTTQSRTSCSQKEVEITSEKKKHHETVRFSPDVGDVWQITRSTGTVIVDTWWYGYTENTNNAAIGYNENVNNRVLSNDFTVHTEYRECRMNR